MRIGVVFPQTELGGDASAVRAYGQRVEELGFTHLLAYDHVVGADPAVHVGWAGPYDVHTTFHEPLVMFGYLAAVTSTLELVTGVIILPQRQTGLVAKQAAEVDLLSEGRLRLGVGLGWNAVEYEALGEDFTNRGKRFGEQVEVMRRLWTEQSVTFDGKHHRVTGAGLAPLPVRRSGWKAASPGSVTHGRSPTNSPSGPLPAPLTCRSTRWARACERSTSTWPRWPPSQRTSRCITRSNNLPRSGDTGFTRFNRRSPDRRRRHDARELSQRRSDRQENRNPDHHRRIQKWPPSSPGA